MIAIYGIRNVEAGNSIQGFLTNKNRFVDRKEALKIAKDMNQIIIKINDRKTLLYSEDLY